MFAFSSDKIYCGITEVIKQQICGLRRRKDEGCGYVGALVPSFEFPTLIAILAVSLERFHQNNMITDDAVTIADSPS